MVFRAVWPVSEGRQASWPTERGVGGLGALGARKGASAQISDPCGGFLPKKEPKHEKLAA